jgi:hypothetical protein
VSDRSQLDRRAFVRSALTLGAVMVLPRALRATSAPPVPMTVYKSATCGCCKEWIKHVEKNGFAVKAIDLDDGALDKIKKESGVIPSLQSCHTAIVGAYTIEGHVPADLIKQVLTEKPAIGGLTVAGMVVGSPGMEQGNAKVPYDVIAFERGGKPLKIYARR